MNALAWIVGGLSVALIVALSREVKAEERSEYPSDDELPQSLPTADHKLGRKVLRAAFVAEMDREPTKAELQLLTGLTGHESGYYGVLYPGSNNWGSILHASPFPPCKPDAFAFKDSTVKCFKKYPSPLEGAKALIRSTFKSKQPGRAAGLVQSANEGSAADFARVLYQSSYFQGKPNQSPEQRIASYADRVLSRAKVAAKALDESMLINM